MAGNKAVHVAVVGAGGRGRGVTRRLLKEAGGSVDVVSLFDPDKQACAKAVEVWASPEAAVCDSYEQAIDAPGVDWVMVFSPNAYHKEQILYAFSKGKHVFSEKPLATTIEDCEAIYAAHKKSGLLFATGFVLRYAPLYRKAKEVLASGKLGRILSIDANENIAPAHGGYIMRNWRRFNKYAGPHILEKCCHDLDLLNWYCESVPVRIAAFGSLDFFIKENQAMLEKYGEKEFTSWPDAHAAGSPFTSEKDVMDTQVGILQYRNGVKVMFQATMSNAIPERRMYFSCTEGTMIVELYSGTLEYKAIGDHEITRLDMGGDGGHGGGDHFISKELCDSMLNGAAPKCSGTEGLESAVVALAYDQAARTNTVINLDPVWREMGRQVASPESRRSQRAKRAARDCPS